MFSRMVFLTFFWIEVDQFPIDLHWGRFNVALPWWCSSVGETTISANFPFQLEIFHFAAAGDHLEGSTIL